MQLRKRNPGSPLSAISPSCRIQYGKTKMARIWGAKHCEEGSYTEKGLWRPVVYVRKLPQDGGEAGKATAKEQGWEYFVFQ